MTRFPLVALLSLCIASPAVAAPEEPTADAVQDDA